VSALSVRSGSLILASALAVPAAGGLARADEPAAESVAAPPPVDDQPVVDHPVNESDATRYRVDRTWLYGDDARVPLPMTAIATSSLSYTNVGNSPTRISNAAPSGASCVNAQGVPQPCYSSFASNTAQPGAMVLVGGELGLLPRTSLQGNVVAGLGGASSVPSPNVGAMASIRYSVLPDTQSLHLVLSGGYVREAWGGPVWNDDRNVWLPGNPNGDNGMFLQAAFSGDVQRLRLAGTIHGEHVFADGRDPLDVMVDLGASYRLTGSLRGGFEYVGQDLEETFHPGAEGGARHFLGPIASIQLFDDRLTIVAGPSVGLSRLSPDFVARAGASLGF